MLVIAAAAFSVIATLMHVVSVGLATYRVTRPQKPRLRAHDAPPVTIIRPLCGVDTFEAETLGSTFSLAYPNTEIVFCCARAQDPVVPLARALIAKHIPMRASLLIGDDRSTANPKLNNLVKGWEQAATSWVVMADSNVLMPETYIDELFAAVDDNTGLVCSPPVGCLPKGWWAEVECAFLNTYQARWQLAADTIGIGFAQGKSMLWRREGLDAAGGIRALAREIAEDAAATKIVRESGKRVRLVDRPFPQPLGAKSATQVWDRQVRWARLRRATFLPCYIPELFTGSLFPVLAAAYAAPYFGLDPWMTAATLAALWLAAEWVLAAAAGWHCKLASPAAWLVRDLLIPVLWLKGFTGHSFTWRGNEMTVAGRSKLANAS